MALTNEQIQQLLPFLFGACAFLLLILYWLKAFIFPWLKVRASGGSKILVRVRNDLHNYYSVGSLDSTFLYFKARKRPDIKSPKKQLPIIPQGGTKPMLRECIYRDWGVNVVEVDDIKECFIKYKNGDYELLPTGNSEIYDLAMQKAMNLPPKGQNGIMDNRMFQIVMVCGIALACIGLIYVISVNSNLMKGLIDVHGHVEHMDLILTNMTGLGG